MPTDPYSSLKQQYDRVVKLMLTVQNVLDDVASHLERWACWWCGVVCVAWCARLAVQAWGRQCVRGCAEVPGVRGGKAVLGPLALLPARPACLLPLAPRLNLAPNRPRRLEGLASWRDPVATGVFCAWLACAALALWLLGLRMLLVLALLWVVRPPLLRDPLPPPPDNYINRLPCVADTLL